MSDPRRSHDSQRFYKEVVLWRRLAHKNILPFLGISTDVAKFCLISPWMENGSIAEYVHSHPDVNPLELVRVVFRGCVYFFPIHYNLSL